MDAATFTGVMMRSDVRCDQQRVVQTLLNTDAETLAGTSDLGSTAPLITAQVLSVTA